MPYGYGSANSGGGGGGPAGGASSGGNYGGGGGHHGGGGGGGQAAQRAAQQAAAQRAMQAQVAAAEKQQAAQAAAQKAAAETQKKSLGETLKDLSGYTQHNIDNQLLKDAVDAGRISENQYKTMGGYNVSQTMPQNLGLGYGDVGLASLGYQGIKKFAGGLDKLYDLTGGKIGVEDTLGMSKYGDIGALESIYLNTMGAKKGLDPYDLQTYKSIIGGYKPVGGMYPGGEKELTPQIKEPTAPTGEAGGIITDGPNKYRINADGSTTNLGGFESPGYQNIFQTGAVSQTPGGAYQPPAPLGTGEGLGSIAGPIQGLINQPKIAGPIQGLIDQPKTAPIINPFEELGARTPIPKPPVRSRIQDERAEDIRKRALGNIALQTDKSLTDVYDPSGRGQGQDIMSGFADTGKSMVGNQLKKAAVPFVLDKLGLGSFNLPLTIAKMFGFDPIGSLMAKRPKGTGTKTTWQPDESSFRGQGQGQAQAQAPANVIQAGVEKFQPTDQQTAQMDEMRRKMMILQGYSDKGQLNEQGMSTLAQMNQLISQYQADPRSIYG